MQLYCIKNFPGADRLGDAGGTIACVLGNCTFDICRAYDGMRQTMIESPRLGLPRKAMFHSRAPERVRVPFRSAIACLIEQN